MIIDEVGAIILYLVDILLELGIIASCQKKGSASSDEVFS
jgi:hypothetical protein